jgi:hypothetical protein
MTATTGVPIVSMARMACLMLLVVAATSAACSGVAWIRSRRSPPAKNVSLAEVRMTPVMSSFSSVSRLATAV